LKIKQFFCKFLLILILVYFSQGWLYDNGSLLSRTLLLLWLLISLCYAIYFILKQEGNGLGITLFIFWSINAIYWVLSSKVVDWYNTIDMLKAISLSMLTYFPFYYFFKNGVLSEKVLKWFVVLFLLISIFVYYISLSSIGTIKVFNENINNVGYSFVFLFPLCGIFFNKKWQFYILYAISLYLIILSSKRGAILTFAIQSVLAFYFLIKSINLKHKLINTIMLLVGMAVIAYFAYMTYISNEFLQVRILKTIEGDSSGRDILYKNIFNKIIEGDSTLAFGYGFVGSVRLIGELAHNDWLEVLSGQGIFGIVIYLSIYYQLFLKYFNNRLKMNAQEKFIYLSSIISMLCISMFSMLYTSLYFFLFVIAITHYDNQKNRHKNGVL